MWYWMCKCTIMYYSYDMPPKWMHRHVWFALNNKENIVIFFEKTFFCSLHNWKEKKFNKNNEKMICYVLGFSSVFLFSSKIQQFIFMAWIGRLVTRMTVLTHSHTLAESQMKNCNNKKVLKPEKCSLYISC